MSSVFIVCLRQPGFRTDYREDPYWEVGSFGCTGCHSRNLFNPTGQHLHDGARLAFAQGGPDGTKLVFVTPGITVQSLGALVEAKWQPADMPFKYSDAALLIDASGRTDFPLLKAFISISKSKKWRQKFSSKFRSRAHSLNSQVATELVEVYQRLHQAAVSRSSPLPISTRFRQGPNGKPGAKIIVLGCHLIEKRHTERRVAGYRVQPGFGAAPKEDAAHDFRSC